MSESLETNRTRWNTNQNTTIYFRKSIWIYFLYSPYSYVRFCAKNIPFCTRHSHRYFIANHQWYFDKEKNPQWSVTLNITEQVNTSRIDIKRTSCSKWQGRRQTTVQYINWLSNQRAIQPYIYIYIYDVWTLIKGHITHVEVSWYLNMICYLFIYYMDVFIGMFIPWNHISVNCSICTNKTCLVWFPWRLYINSC